MAITTFDDYKAKLWQPRERIAFTKNSLTTIAGQPSSLFVASPFAGSVPSTAAVPGRATAGGILQQNGTDLRLLYAELTGAVAGTLWLCDRLSHQGGLSGTVTTAQTTNLPTAALTRSTGEHVFAALEIYTQIGTTATTVAASYTNQGGTAGHTTLAVPFGGTGNREVGRLIILPLQEGDYGVDSVESVTVTATTGTAGNFGVTLFKPLMAFPIIVPGEQYVYDAIISHAGMTEEIQNDTCLFWVFFPSTTSSGVISGVLHFTED